MKRRKTLLLLAGALAAAIGLYAAITLLVPDEDGDTGIEVADIDTAQVTALTWCLEGSVISLSLSDGQWVYPADTALPVDQTVVASMLSALRSVTATLEITSPEAASEYGLDDPWLKIAATLSDGTEYSFELGDDSALTGGCYMAAGSGSSVYTVDSTLASAFTYSLYDIVAMESIPVSGDVQRLTVSGAHTNAVLEYDSSTGGYIQDEYDWFWRSGKASLPVDATAAQAAYEVITELQWSSCADYNASEDEKAAAYGLGGGATTVTVTYLPNGADAASDFTLVISEPDADGICYASIQGSRLIYRVAYSDIEYLTGLSYGDLYPQAVCPMDWDSVVSMTITTQSGSGTVEFGTEASGTAGDDGSQQTVSVYTLNGTQLDTDAFEAVLDEITALNASSLSEYAGDELLFSVTFSRSDGSAVIMTVRSHNSDYCVAAVKDAGYYVNIDTVTAASLLSSLEGILSE